MPGPDGAWGPALLTAVEAGDVPVSAIDRKVHRILTLAARVGALEDFEPAQADHGHGEDGVVFAREAAAEGMVLVRNDHVLPAESATVSRIAVLGHNAAQARSQGGGSATVVPERVVSPLDGIRAAFPDAEVDHAIGAVVQQGIAEFPLATITNPITGEPGARVAFLRDGRELFVEERRATALYWFGGDAPTREADTLEITTTYSPEDTGTVRIGIGSAGRSRMWIDGELVLDETVAVSGDQLGAAFLDPPTRSVPVAATAGRPMDIRISYDVAQDSGLDGVLTYQFGTEPTETDPQQLIDEAVATATGADLAVVVVGTNAKVESEGYDRTSLALPGHQDELVRAVAAANPNTVVVVNAGAPVELPWRDDVAAVLLTWFGGQEFGNALGDVLTGAREPGGRLPTTWPAAQTDVPVLDVTPVNGKVHYAEGVHIGYRAWLREGTAPAYPFGFGLGYTTWEIRDVMAEPDGDGGGAVTATVTNTGSRPGKHVVQVYASRTDTTIDRPARWLVGFQVVHLDASEATEVTIAVPARAFAHWDGGWAYEPGTFTLHVGASVLDIAGSAELTTGP
ncbi:glycoside hydrolase family 3 C-terminal domain-containing protein [Saccharopolyspora erythraea]|uniref:glycoside hydrolase family 3 C-terminal domain-containing protein n=1 Tax=Saccharopolyspora erythraea TaxID=1836 RepID=UPI002012C7DE|nr:glycoside hydrolase family 3 C-terminal domain-containing protein [Saccharopolyspora erythraea]